MSKKVVSIVPHSESQSALEALDSTLSQLPNGGRLRRGPDGAVVVTDGRVLCDCGDAGFIVFAVIAQGYARQAEETDGH